MGTPSSNGSVMLARRFKRVQPIAKNVVVCFKNLKKLEIEQ